VKLSPVFTVKPKGPIIGRFVLIQDTINDVITFQWEFSVLEKSNSGKI
jgi:hypothetical protein